LTLAKPDESFARARPSGPEAKAQAWHDEWHKGLPWTCWCCCRGCRRGNPNLLAARRAAVADIAKRLKDSVASNQNNKR